MMAAPPPPGAGAGASAAAPSSEEFLTQTQNFAMSQLNGLAVDSNVHARLISLIHAGVSFEIRREQKHVEIGRDANCQIILTDKRVSRIHLRIYRDDAFRYFIEQVSGNGAWCNDIHMKKGDTRALHHGDALSICVPHNPPPSAPEEMKPFAAYIFRLADHAGDSASTSSAAAPTAAVGNAAVSSIGAAASTASCPPPGPEATRARQAMLAAAQRSTRLVTDQWVSQNWDMRTTLGSGNFSEVRLGVQVRSDPGGGKTAGGDKFAVKVIDKKKFFQFQSKRESMLSLQSEAEMLMGLDNPGIIKFFQWFETEEKLYIAMEFLEGGDLLQFILEHGCFTEPAARRIFREIVGAVKYLHDRNIVHRDLKPENILLTSKVVEAMRPKLADFGLARMNMKTKDCKTFCGTPHYFAPEVISSFRDRDAGQPGGYGKQADMWSLGVILYIMLSGIPPFEEDGLYEQILSGKYEFDVSEWDQVSPESKELVRQLMHVNPKGRLTIQQTLDHKWFTLEESPSPRDMRGHPVLEREVSVAKRRRTDDGAMMVDSLAPLPPLGA